jgi:DNA-binding transcriptional MerR regulator
MAYTVKQLANLAGVSRRTLHYYDELGLLRPAAHGDNGYRHYGEAEVLRMQQILFYRELGLSLEEIRAILEQPDFDLLHALESHRGALLEQVDRLQRLIETVEKTILHIRGEIEMSDLEFYKGFDEEKQKRRTLEARQRYGDEAMERTKDWNAYTPEQKNAILAEGHEINMGIVADMDKGYDSPQVQYWIGRWHNAINTHFYECSLEVFEALGHGYNQDNEFTEFYESIHPGLAAFMEQAMTYYCQVEAGQKA